MSESIKTIHEKLNFVQQSLKAPKSQYNKFGGYYYRNCEDILKAAKPLLEKVECILTLDDEILQIGDRYYVVAKAEFTNNKGQKIIKTAWAREASEKKGMDVAQITGATSSYARKYALNGLFAIDDARDPDAQGNQNHDKAESAAQQPKSEIEPRFKQPPDGQQKAILEKVAAEYATQNRKRNEADGKQVTFEAVWREVWEEFGKLPTKDESVQLILDRIPLERVLDPVGEETNDIINEFQE